MVEPTRPLPRQGPYVLQCAAMPGWWDARRTKPREMRSSVAGMYLEFYDASHPSGCAWRWTPDPDKARTFPTPKEAFECWTSVNQMMPVRPTDGKPNKPLTMFTVTVLTLDEARADQERMHP